MSPIDRLRRARGGFTMVALDQRESLRAMLGHDRQPVSDAALTRFKQAAATALSPHASAVLLDRPYGLTNRAPPRLADGCALVLAADAFVQRPGEPVQDSDVDPEVTPALVKATGADALKLLVIWRPGDAKARRAATVARFKDLCEAAGVPGIVEGVVRPPGDHWRSDDERDAAILAAAAEFGAHRPDLYKAEVPSRGKGDLARITQRCARITDVLDCPWVVLSTGVTPDDFPAAVEAACRGGADGFLAGRAIWSEAAGAADPVAALEGAVTRLRRLDHAVPGTHGIPPVRNWTC